MKATSLAQRGTGAYTAPSLILDRAARRTVLSGLKGLQQGCVLIVDRSARLSFGQQVGDALLQSTVCVHDPRFYRSLLLGGSVGAAEAFMEGWWSSNDLTTLVRILVLNQDVLHGMERGWARLAVPARRLLHWMRRNTLAGSSRNIASHYDLGNDFFSLFLDETLMYSCAYFEQADSTLREASEAKIDRVCRKLQLSPRDHLLEIGTGWGGFALHAAGRYGCRVTTTTISPRQFEVARQRIRQAGLSHRVTILRKDYRELEGEYDKLVSIEMIEAVGYQYFDIFFRTCSRLLKPDGLMLLQAIVIADQEYERAKREVDFIKRYIFPGSCLPSIHAVTDSLTRVTDMRLFDLEDITPHYATTLRRWRERFLANRDRVGALGFDEAFLRMWEYYFCYCEGAFAERYIGDMQLLLTKPGCRRQPLHLDPRSKGGAQQT